MATVDSFPFISDDGDTVYLDADRSYSIKELRKKGIDITDARQPQARRHPVRDFLHARITTPWLFPSVTDDHEHNGASDSDYRPKGKYKRRDYVARCSYCWDKEFFGRFRDAWLWILSVASVIVFLVLGYHRYAAHRIAGMSVRTLTHYFFSGILAGFLVMIVFVIISLIIGCIVDTILGR